MAVVAAAPAAMVVAGLEVAATPGLEVAATSGLEVAPVSRLEVAAASGSSLDAEVAARSEVAADSEVAGAAAAGSLASGSVTSGGPMMIGGLGGPAAHPGERADCAKSYDLAVTKATPSRLGLWYVTAPLHMLIVPPSRVASRARGLLEVS